MTRPKKWFIEEEEDQQGSTIYVLKNADGHIKKPNASNPLGSILGVTEKDSDTVQFQCENGRIILPLKTHEWNKSTISSKFALIASSSDFVAKWKAEVRKCPHQLISDSRSPTPACALSQSQPSESSTTSGIHTVDLPPSKRCKYIKEEIDISIEQCRKGLMEIPISQLYQPPRESRLLREPDPTFVRRLKQKMMSDPAAPGATPMAVLCKDIDDFNVKYKDVYKYEVLGGLHTLIAKSQLSQEYPDNTFFKKALAEVYVGLSDEQSLRLAQRHNLNSHFVHKITHRDLIEACRARLYQMNSKSMDEETPKPTTEWRESCKKAIIPEGISNTHRDSVFSQASLPKRVWELAIDTMNLFEQAKLKGQKLNLATLTTKPEFKQQYLAPLRRLDEVDQCMLLKKVIDKDCSLNELKVEAMNIKQMAALKTAFLRLTNTATWEEAEKTYPEIACDSQIKKFLRFDLSKSIPQPFIDFCNRAKASEESSVAENSYAIKCCEFFACIIDSKVNEVSGQQIKSVYKGFNGAHLTLISFNKESSRDVMESAAYTIKEINAVAGCHTFCAAAICDPCLQFQVCEVWSKAFVNTEVLFSANKCCKQGKPLTLTECVKVIVLGFTSPDDQLKDEHFCYDQEDPRLNFFTYDGNEEDMYDYILQHFSHDGNTVLDMTGELEGNASYVALQTKRNVVCVMEGEEGCSEVMARLAELT